MNKILVFLLLSLVVLSSCSLLDDTLSGKGKPTIRDGYIDVTQEQIDSYTQKLEWKGVNLSTLPIEYYYNGSRLWFNWTDNRTVKGYNIELKDKKNFKVHKKDKELFDISSTADIHQVDTFEKTGEFAVYSDGWENITYTSNRPLVVKGRYVCYEDSFKATGTGLNQVITYSDCWYNPDKTNKTGKTIINEITKEEITEEISVSKITQLDDYTVVVSSFGDYDPLIYDYSEGLVSCWTLDSDASDYLGYNDGTLNDNAYVNSSDYVIGSGSVDLDGTDDNIQISGKLGSQQSFTLNMWVDIDSVDSAGGEIFSIGDDVVVRMSTSGAITVVRYSSGWTSILDYATDLRGAGFFMLTLTYDGDANSQILYINATPVDTATDSSTIEYVHGSNTYFGKHGNGGTTRDINGRYDEPSFWSRALTSSQVTELFNDGSGISCGELYPLGGLLKACWSLESDGTDTVGSYHLDEQGTINYTTGKVGNAAEFTATSGQYLNNSQFAQDINGITAYTWCNWIESDVTSSDKGWVITSTPTGSDLDFQLRYDADTSGTIRHTNDMTAGSSIDIESSTGIQTTSWQHVCVAWDASLDSGEVQLYVNGTKNNLSTSDSDTNSIDVAASDYLQIGRGSKDATSSWDGLVDEPMFWERRLTASEIAEVYNSGNGLSCNEVKQSLLDLSCTQGTCENLTYFEGDAGLRLNLRFNYDLWYPGDQAVGESILYDASDNSFDMSAVNNADFNTSSYKAGTASIYTPSNDDRWRNYLDTSGENNTDGYGCGWTYWTTTTSYETMLRFSGSGIFFRDGSNVRYYTGLNNGDGNRIYGGSTLTTNDWEFYCYGWNSTHMFTFTGSNHDWQTETFTDGYVLGSDGKSAVGEDYDAQGTAASARYDDLFVDIGGTWNQSYIEDLNDTGIYYQEGTYTKYLNLNSHNALNITIDCTANTGGCWYKVVGDDTWYNTSQTGISVSQQTLAQIVFKLNTTDQHNTPVLHSFTVTEYNESGGADTCTYSSGNWNVLCSDNCVISSPVDLNNNNLIISGSGTFTANAAISNAATTSVECLAAFVNLG